MSLKTGEQRMLDRIEDDLASSDLKLTTELAMFNRLGAGEAFPGREQIRSGPHPCRQLAWPLMWFAVCVALIAAALLAARAGGTGADGTGICPGWSAVCI